MFATQLAKFRLGLTGDDPIELGFVKAINRPGGNMTVVSLLKRTCIRWVQSVVAGPFSHLV
jgi:hypothetical protein